jgi:GntR family transcriptional regulator
MFIRLENSSGVPISRQIADAIRLHCSSGVLRAGDRLPSVRALARELAVNQNTILHVYERLTGEGLLERRHGDGTFVARTSSREERKRQGEAIGREVEGLVRKAAALGLEPEDLHEALDSVWERIRKERPATGTAREGGEGEPRGGKP